MAPKKEREVLLILHDIRSAHNVGAMFRTADGAGVKEIILSGYTPVPPKSGVLYLTPADKAFKKTALGAEDAVSWKKVVRLTPLLNRLKKEGYTIIGLEQHSTSKDYRFPIKASRIALLVGNEVSGMEEKTLKQCDLILEIPMRGKKNSLNVSVATGIALYQITSTIEKE
jgi:23S rRNA (guanosine2251-2'-O)-methyltransferase